MNQPATEPGRAHSAHATPLHFPARAQADIEARPLLFCSFVRRDANDQPVLAPVSDWAQLRKALEERLAEYNESNAGGWRVGV